MIYFQTLNFSTPFTSKVITVSLNLVSFKNFGIGLFGKAQKCRTTLETSCHPWKTILFREPYDFSSPETKITSTHANENLLSGKKC